MKEALRDLLPDWMWHALKRGKWRALRAAVKGLNGFGLNVALQTDYYSPLPAVDRLRATKQRWFQPSKLAGIQYDLEATKDLLTLLVSQYGDEYCALPAYEANAAKGYGIGYNAFDAMLLYCMIRHIKPNCYLEVGSGLSTYYCSLSAQQNGEAGKPARIVFVEPNPYQALYSIPSIEVIADEVQMVPLSVFEERLDAGDVLFIDSSHIVKIDGDVPYLYLEVLPRLKKGVMVHIHDVHFPYNVPYPPDYWMLEADWPIFWNEAMLLQAFLAFNDSFRIVLAPTMLRYFDEDFLRANVPRYDALAKGPASFSSIWLERVK